MASDNILFNPSDQFHSLRFPSVDREKPDSFGAFKEIVFIGDLSIIGGLKAFFDAVDLTVAQNNAFSYQITFIGASSNLLELSSKDYIELRALNWDSLDIKWSIKADMDYASILEYMTAPQSGRLAVMPSLVDVSSVLEQELVNAGVPFIGSTQSSIAELLDSESQRMMLTKPEGEKLAQMLQDTLKQKRMFIRKTHIASFCSTNDEIFRDSRLGVFVE